MKIIIPTAAVLGLSLSALTTGLAFAQATTADPSAPPTTTAAPPPVDNDRGVRIDGSGAAVPAPVPSAGAETASPGAPSGSSPTGSYPATSDTAPRSADVTERTTARPAAIANPKNTMKTSAAPVPGKNSFTATQARKRFEDNGYTQITGLAKDKNSIWRAQAMKGGKQTAVALDYQGNIVETP